MHPLLTSTPNFLLEKTFRVGLIYDDTIRADTTGRYCLKYLSNLCNVTHLLPKDLQTTAKEDYDLFLHVDDGMDYVIPNYLFPRAWWVIDTHLNLERDIEKAHFYDWVFAAQKNGAEALVSAGIINVWWLPLAGDPLLTQNTEKSLDWSFVGHWDGEVFGDRGHILHLAKEIGHNFIGQATPENRYKIYESSKAVLNPPIRDDINMRVFEAMAAGAVLITKRFENNGMDELFEDGVDYLSYETPSDAVNAILRVMNMSEEEQETVRKNAREKALSRDSYGHRMQALLEVVCTVDGIQAQYFRHVRNEVLALVPASAHTVLDIGCATGKLGEAIKLRQECHVSGIEMHPRAALEAKKVLDTVYVGSAEDVLNELQDFSFDCIILADVLEHMLNPWVFLRKLIQKLDTAPHSRVILSIPNVAHWSVVIPLMQGEWTYHDAGILDATHLRFFTPQSAARMINGAQLDIEAAQGVMMPRPENLTLPDNGIVKNWIESGLGDVYQLLFVCMRRST